jgi:hypothetical protein
LRSAFTVCEDIVFTNSGDRASPAKPTPERKINLDLARLAC